jgi:hypothetical protein
MMLAAYVRGRGEERKERAYRLIGHPENLEVFVVLQ